MKKPRLGQKRSSVVPLSVRKLFWSYDTGKLDTEIHQKTILTQIVNYGNLPEWRWAIKTYGKPRIRKVLASVPAAAIRPPARQLAKIIF